MTLSERMEDKLRGAFAPAHLDIVDESARHEGHAGAREGGETHFRVTIVALAFAGLSRVARHRLVHDALAEELHEQVHALALTTLTPEEYSLRR